MTKKIARGLLILGLAALITIVALRVIPAITSRETAPTAPDTTGTI